MPVGSAPAEGAIAPPKKPAARNAQTATPEPSPCLNGSSASLYLAMVNRCYDKGHHCSNSLFARSRAPRYTKPWALGKLVERQPTPCPWEHLAND